MRVTDDEDRFPSQKFAASKQCALGDAWEEYTPCHFFEEFGFLLAVVLGYAVVVHLAAIFIDVYW